MTPDEEVRSSQRFQAVVGSHGAMPPERRPRFSMRRWPPPDVHAALQWARGDIAAPPPKLRTYLNKVAPKLMRNFSP